MKKIIAALALLLSVVAVNAQKVAETPEVKEFIKVFNTAMSDITTAGADAEAAEAATAKLSSYNSSTTPITAADREAMEDAIRTSLVNMIKFAMRQQGIEDITPYQATFDQQIDEMMQRIRNATKDVTTLGGYVAIAQMNM